MKLQNKCTFYFRIEGQLSELSEVQAGALKELFADGGAVNAHVNLKTEEGKEIYCVGFTDNIVKNLKDLCKWISDFHQTTQKILTISEEAEEKLKSV